MTICIAAICLGGSALIGVSDRMVTAGDIQFEPPQPKIMPITSSIVVLIAGDSATQTEILYKLRADVDRRIEEEPYNWWRVSDVAELYRQYYNQARLKSAEDNILSPLGLDRHVFISRQNELSNELVKLLATELLNHEISPVETIFAGTDTEGLHIYVARNGKITCQDTVGFASIGAGHWHADSQFMFSGHTKDMPLPETLLLTYSAKKRAEVAPGVGSDTDMFMIGTQLGSYRMIYPSIINDLQEIYERRQQRDKESSAQAKNEVNQYVEEIARAATIQEQAIPQDSGGNEATD